MRDKADVTPADATTVK